ncbi:MAG: phosphoribosylamine--glycine ligase, partial [Bacilli bacterium]|nr:phosphoribosylamine--glycine ligase [Bacilli bacterium]
MKVLVIGSGGREHAICYALNKSKKVTEIHAIPGNPGIGLIGKCHDIKVDDLEGILKFVNDNNIDFTVVGPEVPLCMGLVDLLEKNGHKAFGPVKEAANLEGSKAFSKDFMKKYNIPTASSIEVHSYEEGLQALDKFNLPVVIKADGLAAGKGVVICESINEAKNALKEIMVDDILSGAGKCVVIEEFLTGFECSLLCFTDGITMVPMVYAKDHKQIYDGNKGPNTGGMGTVSPNPFMPEEMDKVLKEDILDPILLGFKESKMDFRGVLFIGLMIENGKAKVLEFNVRFGDPETQVIMLRLDSDLFDIMYATSTKTLKDIEVKWKDTYACCLVLASSGYPGKYEK